ncbi:HNH endonuclease signature motif containing protein [Petrachloros mirabilis]
MPTKPLRPCSRPGCPNLTKSGRCNSCKAKSGGEQRLAPWRAREQKWRNSARWRGENGLRQRQLKREPLCRECVSEGRIEPATDVDHVIAAHGDPKRFWNINNLQSLCHSHHSRKTASES